MPFITFQIFLLLFPVSGFAETLDLAGSKIEVRFKKFQHLVSKEEVLAFVSRSAAPVAAHYGVFPVRKLRLQVLPNSRRPKGLFGQEFYGKEVKFYLGPAAPEESLRHDGILTHEFFHLGFPDLGNDLAWVEEGLATYLTHISMSRAGQVTEEATWLEIRDGFQDSQEEPDPEGLNNESEYRKYYWGGALFWHLMDLEIREKTQGKLSLDTITRSIQKSGVHNGHKWSLSRLRRAIDKSAGFTVFEKWFQFFGTKAAHVDLPAHWKKLGVIFDGNKVTFDNTAPLASVRRAITEKR